MGFPPAIPQIEMTGEVLNYALSWEYLKGIPAVIIRFIFSKKKK